MNDRAERFFTWVWRLDGLLLLALAAAAAVGALAIGFNVAMFASRERPEQQLAKVAGTDLAASELRLGDFWPIQSTRLLVAELASPSEYIGSGSSDGRGAAHNLLFFDTQTKKAHWLLAGNEQTIVSHSVLWDPPGPRYGFERWEAGQEDREALAILLEIEEPHAARAAKSRRLVLTAPDGRSLTPVVDSIDALLGFHQPARDSVLVFYVAAGAARVVDLDPVARKVRSDQLLSTGP